MNQFCWCLNDAVWIEIHLQGRLYTWSNKRCHPTLERIDRAFISSEWEAMFPSHDMQALTSGSSDHTPVLLRTENVFHAKKHFLFRSFWPKFPGFLQAVSAAWHCPLRDADPFRRLDCLLCNTTCVLRSWSGRFIGNIRMQLELAKEVVLRLEIARDRCVLSGLEESLRQELKLKSLGLASLRHTITQQESHLLWLKEGDAPTQFFHAHANVRHHN
jgi:hypothetical protein